jgi:hypothetical protein
LSVERCREGKKTGIPRRSPAASDAARDDERARLVFGGKFFGRADERAYDNVLKARGQIFDGLRRLFALRDGFEFRLADVLRDCGLQTAEAEIGPTVAHARHAEPDGSRVAFAGESFDYRAARITESEHLRNLVISLARRVVARAREHLVLAGRGD